jgi:hypothetical protein
LGQRSRKRGQRSVAGGAPSTGAPTQDVGAARPTATKNRGNDAATVSRSEQRAEAARARLEPLAEGERPGAVTVAAAVAALLAVLVVVGYATGARIGTRGSLAGAILLAALMLVAAVGMWRVRYWAVLGFEALLAFQVIVASLSLLVASNLWAVVLCVALIGAGGWLFWKLIRAMARIQMPERRPR